MACDGLQSPTAAEEFTHVAEVAQLADDDGAELGPAVPTVLHAGADSRPGGRHHVGAEVEPADPTIADPSHHLGAGRVEQLLPAYYDFVRALNARGFVFMDFDGFWHADKAQLPAKLIVVRHDVHQRDIAPAYAMRAVEHALLAERSATYFVMLGFPPELGNTDVQQQYLDLITKLKADGVDVQPHISPNDLYVSQYQPSWGKKSLEQLHRMTDGDYTIEQYDDGVEITSVPHDPLDIRMINARFVELLTSYNQRWTAATGLTVRSYASHGSHLALNLILNNATMLDQRELIAAGVYEFDTYNTRVMNTLQYLSDNDELSWMDHPEQVADGQYQLLAHPRSWTPTLTAQRLAAATAAAEAAEAAAGDAQASGGASTRQQ